MKKLIAGLLATGLLVSVVGPVAAKKSKTVNVYLRQDGANGECGANYLSLEDAPDEGSGCSYTAQPAQEVLTATGGQLIRSWPGAFSKPIRLGSGSIKAEWVVHAYAAPQVTLEVTLSATTAKGTTEIGALTTPAFNASLAGEAPVEFEMAIPKSLVGQKVSGLSMTTSFRGVGAQPYIELDAPPAILIVPTK